MKEYLLYIRNINGYSGWLASTLGTINLLGGFITPVISAHKCSAVLLNESEMQNIIKRLVYYGIAYDIFEKN